MEAWTHWVSFCLVGYNPLFIGCLSCLVVMLFFMACACLHILVCVPGGMSPHSGSGSPCKSSSPVTGHLIFWNRVLHCTLSKPICLGWLACGWPPASAFWASGLQALQCYYTTALCFWHWFWVDSGSSMCVHVVYVRACVCVEHFSHWAISLLPTP